MYCPCSTAAIVIDTGQWYRCTADITAPLFHAVLQEDGGQWVVGRIFNPRPEGYGSRLVIHSLTLGTKGYGSRFVVHSFILSSGIAFTSTPQLRHERDRHVKIFRFDSWILLKRWRSRVMAGSL